ncbi:hypothetical protein K402DRAFT_340513 [Aulographum hederae CBS 113979]|uniref:Uncharacterized protein n=1 Tax=Aulographum hederae CBS 113979 TaxID=1176131 RepID=A0A6G1GN03_9PEZI|nr:hypothetical protein K402DRAFT_340513 [Aulographum hederae CBS 113979]
MSSFRPTIRQQAHPPHRVHKNRKPLSQTAAHALLSTYLTRADTLPYLHPDALLAPSGPTYAAASGPMGGIILHNLRRVEAGLRGEVLKPEILDLEVPEQEAAKHSAANEDESQWQDKAEYELQQGADDPDARDDENFLKEGGGVPMVKDTGSVPKEANRDDIDKEMRKKLKDERKKMEKEERAKAKKAKKAAAS